MIDELRTLDTSPRSLRRFGVTVGAVLAAVGGVVMWRAGMDSGTARVLLAVGAVLLVGGAVAPRALRVPYLAWMALALALGFVMTRVLLTVVYFGIVTPIGLMLRIAGRDPVNRRPDPSVTSYWIEREPVDDPVDRLTRYY